MTDKIPGQLPLTQICKIGGHGEEIEKPTQRQEAREQDKPGLKVANPDERYHRGVHDDQGIGGNGKTEYERVGI